MKRDKLIKSRPFSLEIRRNGTMHDLPGHNNTISENISTHITAWSVLWLHARHPSKTIGQHRGVNSVKGDNVYLGASITLGERRFLLYPSQFIKRDNYGQIFF